MSLNRDVASQMISKKANLAVAESCTGGLIAQLLTDLPGSSAWFERGVVTYSNAAKESLLGVPAALLKKHGAVSRETVSAMAAGLRDKAPVQWTLAVTGIAGPDGGTEEKPVGLVWAACAGPNQSVKVRGFKMEGDRQSIRQQAAEAAFKLLLDQMAAFYTDI